MKDLLWYRHTAFRLHESVNQLYDGKPFSEHLMNVEKAIIDNHEGSQIWLNYSLIAGYFHDSIEDARITFNDLTQKYFLPIESAEIVYAVTNEKGRNRAERANTKYYKGIRSTPGAVFVKLCDRIANVEYSKKTGSSMFDMYRKEHSHFMEILDAEYLSPKAAHYLNSLFT